MIRMTSLRTMLNSSYSGNNLTTVASHILHNGTSPASAQEQIALASVIVFLGVWSTFGNTLTILAITTQPKMLTKCNLFILSLATSDLLSGVIASPLWIYRRTWGFYHWNWGQFLCKLFWFTDEATSYCTALHIASFAIWRLIGVKWPFTFEATKRRKIAIWLLILWLLSAVFGGFLFSYFYEVAEKGDSGVARAWPMCSIRLSHNGINEHKIYYTFSSTLFMLFPMVILAVASLLLVKELYFKKITKSQNRKNKERKAALQLALISTSFWVGYMPMTSYVMWTTRATNKRSLFDYWFHVAAYLSLRLSECLNPLMYNAASSNMRTASKNVWNKIRMCRKYYPYPDTQYSRKSQTNANKPPCSPKLIQQQERSSRKEQFLMIPINHDVTRSIF